MPFDGVIPQDELTLQELITESVKDGSKKVLRIALETYDEYVWSCRPINDPETHGIAATLWRELKEESRLLNAYWAIEHARGVKGDLRANIRRELGLFYAQQDKHELAARYMDEMPKHRSSNNIEQKIVDATANAKRIMYATNYWGALNVAASVDDLLEVVPRIVHQDVKDNSWWRFTIAVQARDFASADQAARWLTGGRVVRDDLVSAELKRSRRGVVNAYLQADRAPVGHRFIQRRLVQTALLYDKYR